AEIEKERAIEEEKKNIQDVIKERIMVEKKVVEEEEKIKDTRELAAANRTKEVTLIKAQETGDATVITRQKEAEAEKLAAEIRAETLLIDAEAEKNAASKEAEARKIQADAKAAEEATLGLSEAQVIEAKAKAKEQEGLLEATVLEKKAVAEAAGIEARTAALRKQGMMEAEVLKEKGASEAEVIEKKGIAEAKGVAEKAKAMKELDGVGKEHEEFKLRLQKEKEIELAAIQIQQHIAEAQSIVLAEAFKKANIDIVGGDQSFINNVLDAVSRGKRLDRMIGSSESLTDLKHALLGNGGEAGLFSQIRSLIGQSGMSSEDLKNLTLSALLLRLRGEVGKADQSLIEQLMGSVERLGLGDHLAKNLV
ncbi:MAG: flotillin family protein, partial [Phaeodactylibacter sp.]|nr:flotillin family protein [Phaeodactylibacter sp.]